MFFALYLDSECDTMATNQYASIHWFYQGDNLAFPMSCIPSQSEMTHAALLVSLNQRFRLILCSNHLHPFVAEPVQKKNSPLPNRSPALIPAESRCNKSSRLISSASASSCLDAQIFVS